MYNHEGEGPFCFKFLDFLLSLSLSLTFLILLFLSKCFLEASFYFFSPLPPLLFHCYLPLSGNLINLNVTRIFTNSLKFSGCFAAWPLAHRFHFQKKNLFLFFQYLASENTFEQVLTKHFFLQKYKAISPQNYCVAQIQRFH